MEVGDGVQTVPSLAPSLGQQVKGRFYRRYGKRLMDVVLSLCAIVLLSPLLLIVALLVRVKLGSPVIFRQERPGLNEKIFTLYKFRTMTDECDENGRLLPDAQRLTRFGRWLRSTSLDELPELFNVLKGDMSIVGPRPLLVQYLSLYDDQQRRRHEVRPGMTGLAQVSGRNSIEWEDKFRLDVFYVDSMCLATDLKIMLMTIRKVVAKESIEHTQTKTIYDALVRGQSGAEKRVTE